MVKLVGPTGPVVDFDSPTVSVEPTPAPTPPPPPDPAPVYTDSDYHLKFVQTTAAATWVWTHNLGHNPQVHLFPSDSPIEAVITDITYPDENTLIIEWPAPISGVAYI